ncbi:MAG: dihydropteroate synthase, partial [Spirochaetia bacterium]
MPIRMELAHGRVLDCSGPPLVMGVLNCTPDSFYPGSRVGNTDEAIRTAQQMIAAGVDILDIGGESTRPGSEPVAASDELARTQPVVQAIRAVSNLPISIDTRKACVAEAALEAGADIINDVSALRADPEMLPVARDRDAVVVLMHMLGTPRTMQDSPRYDDVVHEILHFLTGRAQEVISAGVAKDRIIIDPGIGFGKRLEDNLRLIADLPAFGAPGFPVLVGASRKSFIAKVLAAGLDNHPEPSGKPGP